MNGMKSGKSDNTELAALNQNNIKRLTPNEEYQKGIRRRRGGALLFVLLLLIEMQFGLLLLGGVIDENLHNRIMQQIQNTNDGQILFETGTYVGETDFGYLVGEGTFNFASGTVYTGRWSNNLMNGQGVLNVPSEGTYTGEFLDSEKSGQGTFVWDDGAVYDGEWKYDGSDHSKVQYTVTFGPDGEGQEKIEGTEGQTTFTLSTGDTITISGAPSVKNVKDSEANNNTFSYVLTHADQYETVTPTYGTLTITTRSVVMTSATDSKEYDGKALTNDEVTETGDGFIEGEGCPDHQIIDIRAPRGCECIEGNRELRVPCELHRDNYRGGELHGQGGTPSVWRP